jgi:tetratricopeptide (TPR) repeat protein
MSKDWNWLMPLVLGCGALPATQAIERPASSAEGTGDVAAHVRAAEQALRSNQLLAAEAAAKEGIEIAQQRPTSDTVPSLMLLYRALGIVHVQRRQYAEAEQAFSTAIAWSKRSSTSPGEEGYLTLLMGRSRFLACELERARSLLERVVQIKKPFVPAVDIDIGLAWTTLAQIDEESGQDLSAYERLVRAILVITRSAVGDPAALGDALHEKASVQERLGQRDDATRTLRQLIELAGHFPVDVNVGVDAPKYQTLVGPGADAFLAKHGIIVWRHSPSRAAGTNSANSQDDPGPLQRCAKNTPTPPPEGVANAERVVGELRRAFRTCFQRELESQSNAAGHIRTTATVGTDGSVASVLAVGSGLSTSMLDCVGTQVAGAKFSPPAGGRARIVIPVTFMMKGTVKTPRLPF